MPIALQDIYKEVEHRTMGYELGSQSDSLDPLVVTKLFDIVGSSIWYITEYCPKKKIFFGYVEALTPDPWCDEWGSTSLGELAALKWLRIPRIECDIHFKPTRFSKIEVRE